MEPVASLVIDLVRWWSRAGWGARVVVLLGVAGVALLGLSMLPGPPPDDAWLRDFLMTVGGSLALFSPFYLITRSLDRHLDQVTKDTAEQVKAVRTDTAQQVQEVRSEAAAAKTELAGEVQALRADVDRRLEDVAAHVTARLQEEAAADEAAFEALRTTPTRDAVWDAFVRAQDLGLVSSQRPPRVKISDHGNVYAAVVVDTDTWADEPLQLRVEDLAGGVSDWIPWPVGRDATDVLVEVGRALWKHTSETFRPADFLAGMADLLEAALSHPERRPAIQLCPPQWMVCDWGVIAYGKNTYGVNIKHLQTSTTVRNHVPNTKGWVDPDSWDAACEAALALFPRSPWDEPPF